MPPLPIRLDAIPIVRTTSERGVRFPDPDLNQRVQNLETGCFERWNGVSWVTDFSPISATGTPAVQQDGVQIIALPQVLNFGGPGVVITRDGSNAVITIPGGPAQVFQQGGEPVAAGPSVVNVTGPGAPTLSNPSDGVVQMDFESSGGGATAQPIHYALLPVNPDLAGFEPDVVSNPGSLIPAAMVLRMVTGGEVVGVVPNVPFAPVNLRVRFRLNGGGGSVTMAFGFVALVPGQPMPSTFSAIVTGTSDSYGDGDIGEVVISLGGATSAPNLRAGSDPTKFQWDDTTYTLDGDPLTLPAGSAAFSAADVVTGGKFGAFLVQVDDSQVVTTKDSGTPQAFDTAAEAIASLPPVDDGNVLLGIIVVGADGDWTANTDNLTTDPDSVAFHDGAAVGASGTTLAVSLVATGVPDTMEVLSAVLEAA